MKTSPMILLATLLSWDASLATSQAAEIHDAARAGDVVCLTTILATNRALVHLGGEDNLTPLHSAARAGQVKAATLLLESGADVNAKDVHGCTPLHSAIYGQHTPVAKLLLEHEADANAARTDGTTPLYYAAKDGSTNLVKLLLQRGAKPDAPPGGNHVPLLAAARYGHLAVIELLTAAGATLDATDENGHTALHMAATAGNRVLVEWLLNHGADANASDRYHRRPVDYATGATNDALVVLLAEYMLPLTDFTPPTKVGDAGDLDRLVFEGVQTFSSDQIRHALLLKPSYLLASHPQAKMGPFLEELQKKVRTGYQSGGFPGAQVDVIFDPAILRTRVKVAEGPRFRAGKIRVVGAKSSSREALVRWLTTAPETYPPEKKRVTTIKSIETKRATLKEGWTVKASADLTTSQGPGLNTPGKVERSKQAMWSANDPVDFSALWSTQAVAQVESCLAEQGFFFPQAKVTLQRNPKTGTADLLVTITSEGPPGVIGQIAVTGAELNQADDIIRFLHWRQGMKFTAESLATARRKLRDCGRFRYYEITPEYAGSTAKISSRQVNLHIEVKEQEGVPRLTEPLSPVQQALIRTCEWLESFPNRDEEIRVAVRNPDQLPVTFDFVLSPRHGLLLNAELEGAIPLAAGFLLTSDTVQLCAWSASNKVAAAREGSGKFFLHVLPETSGGTNKFHLAIGGGYSGGTGAEPAPPSQPLQFDIQLSRAAFLNEMTRDQALAYITNGHLVVTNEGVLVRAEAKTGRILEVSRPNDQTELEWHFGDQTWSRDKSNFIRRSENLPNSHTPGHSFSALLSMVTGEAARIYLARASGITNAEQQRLATAAIRRLTAPELLAPLDWIIPPSTTNDFGIPLDEVDGAMAQSQIATLFSGLVFDWSNELFPKYSWPWTAARESAFVMMNHGRYTDVELARLYSSEDTGPVGYLALGKLLSTVNPQAAKSFAMQGLLRLSPEDFLRDCNLFLQGESGLARSFTKLTEILKTLPADELAALVATLPEPEGALLRDGAAAMRANPEAAPATVLAPALGKYWKESLRTKVRESLRRVMAPPPASGGSRI